ncbi:hypothetical protein MLD38_015719 [Melastoma candidum]|uniref:Uncharacterized protein n=1 Tax=Melastoma candidum TaxID=119954 RepID=A0ACB9RIY4_9MYRT|nr:hypothetical protein MLD38_015719 [Melastoma candidum]
MGVLENSGVDVGQSARDLDRVVAPPDSNPPLNYTNGNDARIIANVSTKVTSLSVKDQNGVSDAVDGDGDGDGQVKSNGVRGQQIMGAVKNGGYENGVVKNGGVRNIVELAEMLSKLNPMAAEFVPPSFVPKNGNKVNGKGFGYGVGLRVDDSGPDSMGFLPTKRRDSYQSKSRIKNRTNMAQHEEIIRRTVYVSDIDQQVTEEQLAALFKTCGLVVDCRVCGDPNSCLHFAFIEFTEEEGAKAALGLSGMMLGFYPVRVMPSKTAIAPVNPTLLPRSDDEREMCSRTVYCTNIDRKVTQADVKIFFESLCGEVQRLRLLGDYQHPMRIAFVEFVMAESAIAALSCSGAILGSFPIRVSPSKTPVRPRIPRPQMRGISGREGFCETASEQGLQEKNDSSASSYSPMAMG